MTDDAFDRDAILARRAMLLSSALALMHCSPSPGPTVSPLESGEPAGSSAPLVQSSTPSATASGSAALPPTVTSLPGDRTWEQAIAAGPPFASGARLPADEQKQFEQLNQALRIRYDEVRALWDGAKGLCDAAQPDCKPAWRALGEKLKTATQSLRAMGSRLCGGGDNPPSIGQSRGEHLAFLHARLEDAEQHLAKVAASFGAQGEQEWLKHAANAKVTPPMPCLSCAAPEVWPISTVVLFDAGSSTLSATATQSLTRVRDELKQQLSRPTSPIERIEVRGHTDPQEKDGEKLSLSRAQAVIAWLGSNGLKDPKLVAAPLGPALPISATAARNQRVELVIKGKGIRP